MRMYVCVFWGRWVWGGHYTCDMICMLKLGERDCFVSGAPGESSSWLPPRCPARCSSCRLIVEWRWPPPAPDPGPPPPSTPVPRDPPIPPTPPPTPLPPWLLPFRLVSVWSRERLDEVLAVRARARPDDGRLGCLWMRLSSMPSSSMGSSSNAAVVVAVGGSSGGGGGEDDNDEDDCWAERGGEAGARRTGWGVGGDGGGVCWSWSCWWCWW